MKKHISEGPALQPSDPAARARMNVAMAVLDNYAYGALITRMFIPRAVVPMLGGETDEAVIEGAKADAAQSVSVLNGMLDGGYFAGDACSLADLHVLPVMHYASQIPEGQALLGDAPALSGWLDRMNQRDSARSTVPQLG